MQHAEAVHAQILARKQSLTRRVASPSKGISPQPHTNKGDVAAAAKDSRPSSPMSVSSAHRLISPHHAAPYEISTSETSTSEIPTSEIAPSPMNSTLHRGIYPRPGSAASLGISASPSVRSSLLPRDSSQYPTAAAPVVRYPRDRSPAFSPRVSSASGQRPLSGDPQRMSRTYNMDTSSRNVNTQELSVNWRERHQKRMELLQRMGEAHESGQPEPEPLSFVPPYVADKRRHDTKGIHGGHMNQKEVARRSGPSVYMLDYTSQNHNEVPREVFDADDLLNLNLSQNRLRFLPEKFGRAPLQTSLISLDLSHNMISRLPTSFSNLAGLKELNLMHNSINNLDGFLFLGMMGTLEILKLNWNKLSYLPKSIGDLQALRYFDASCNQITGLPQTVDEMHNLRTLLLYQNKISTLPEQFSCLRSMEELDISINPIFHTPVPITSKNKRTTIHYEPTDALDYVFHNMPNIFRLGAAALDMKKMNPFVNKLRGLLDLKISNNELSQLPNSLLELSNLEVLDASRNLLVELPKDIGFQLTNLRRLDISSNKLDVLPPSFFCFRNHLKYLDARFNHLQVYSADLNDWMRLGDRQKIEVRVDDP